MRRRGSSTQGRILLLAIALWVPGCAGEPAGDPSRVGRLRVEEVLGGDPAGFAVADRPRSFAFPADHGPHPDFRSEWWYVTGNVADSEGRPFGFQVTFFRSALSPDPVRRASAWGTRQAYMGHLAVTDPRAGDFRAHERFARGALGLAGASIEPLRVWVQDWELAAAAPDPSGVFPLRLVAGAGGDGVELLLEPDKPPVLQGQDGLSRKGAEPANASYYYSYTRLRARGSIRVGGRQHRVSGAAWVDREWSTSALEPGQAGWDWFALQLEDGHDVMLYLMRREDGGTDPHSSGVVVGPTGAASHLQAGEFDVTVLEEWRSPDSGVSYPSRWRLSVPAHDLVLEVEPLLADQELDLAFRYWEGAVEVHGRRAGAAVSGRGYVELTGYASGSSGGAAGASSKNSERSNR